MTELPYAVGPERVMEKIADLVRSKKVGGISDVTDLTDRSQGLRLVIEIKNGFHPEAVLEELFRLTPMEETFGINNVCLVDGQPRTLGLRELLQVYVDHRLEVVRRRSTYRRTKAQDRLHLLEGLLVALLDIDEVIQVIRTCDDAAEARDRLRQVFDLSEVQANYILDMQLRRLTRFSRLEVERERDELVETIAALTAILEDDALLRRTVSSELRRSPRRTRPRGAPFCSSRSDCPVTRVSRTARGRRRAVPRAALLDRAARADDERRPAARARVRGPRTTRWSRP